MPVPTAITDLSQTGNSNYPAGGNTPADLDDVQRAHGSFIAMLRDGKGFTNAVSLASATTTDIGAQNSLFVEISGTTTITSFGTNYNGPRFLRFLGALTLTYNASTLILPTSANITTAANDTAIAIPVQGATGWVIVSYIRANGNALVSATNYLDTTRIDVASATTVNLTSSAPNTRHINITGTTAITGFTVAVGLCYFVRFAGSLSLSNNASIVTPTGATITTTAGDTCIIRATAANVVEVMMYSAAPSSSTPLAPGSASAGTSAAYARGDHVHPTILSSTIQSEITASGTFIDVTSIPSWVNRINITVNEVSTNGASNITIQLGDSGGIETSGYVCGLFQFQNVSANSTSGFLLTGSYSAAYNISGNVVINRVAGNKWTFSSVIGFTNVTSASFSSGTKTLSATLDRIRFTTDSGTDSFDSGTFGVSWE